MTLLTLPWCAYFETTVTMITYMRIFDVRPDHGIMIRNKHCLGGARQDFLSS